MIKMVFTCDSCGFIVIADWEGAMQTWKRWRSRSCKPRLTRNWPENTARKGWGPAPWWKRDRFSTQTNELCETYEKEEIDSALKKVVAEFVFINEVTEYNPLLNKYFNACCSLTENDIAFLEIIADWTPEEKKTRYREWSTKKIDFQTIASPAFRQWLSIFGKNFSQQFQKEKTENKKQTEEKKQKKEKKQKQAFRNFTQQLDKMTDKEIYSLLYLYQRLKDLRELNKKEAEKYPFGPPEQIGLLLQFKYCLSTSEQKSVLEHEMDATKAAGDH